VSRDPIEELENLEIFYAAGTDLLDELAPVADEAAVV
jgi:hypothetical protein